MKATSRASTRRRRTGYSWSQARSAVALVALLISSSACTTTPITGRQSLNLLSRSEDMQLGEQAYDELLSEATFITSGPAFDQVQEVVARLVEVAHYSDEFDWEVRLVDDDSVVNAWCLPGGKMAVYTGILPFTRDATGLAVVMGHEIGHAIARHGTQRMTQQMGVELVLAYIGGELGPEAEQIGAQVANFGIFLPWGRSQELEADHIGLMYMAQAGYDPNAAVGFWQRMAGDQGQTSTLEGLASTHPSSQARIEQIEELLPEARGIYGRNRVQP